MTRVPVRIFVGGDVDDIDDGVGGGSSSFADDGLIVVAAESLASSSTSVVEDEGRGRPGGDRDGRAGRADLCPPVP